MKTKQNIFYANIVLGCMIALHLALADRVQNFSLLSNSIIVWAAVFMLLQSKWQELEAQHDIFSMVSGFFLLFWVFLKTSLSGNQVAFLHVYPLIALLGIVLLVSGFSRLQHYWQEMLLVCFLALSPEAAAKVIDITLITTNFSAQILQHLGWTVFVDGSQILLTDGGIEVTEKCSGIGSIIHLLELATILLFMVPTSRRAKVVISVFAALLAFVTNCIRVSIMALLSRSVYSEQFDYWHTGVGSHLFTVSTVLIFFIFCYCFLKREQRSTGRLTDILA